MVNKTGHTFLNAHSVLLLELWFYWATRNQFKEKIGLLTMLSVPDVQLYILLIFQNFLWGNFVILVKSDQC